MDSHNVTIMANQLHGFELPCMQPSKLVAKVRPTNQRLPFFYFMGVTPTIYPEISNLFIHKATLQMDTVSVHSNVFPLLGSRLHTSSPLFFTRNIITKSISYSYNYIF